MNNRYEKNNNYIIKILNNSNLEIATLHKRIYHLEKLIMFQMIINTFIRLMIFKFHILIPYYLIEIIIILNRILKLIQNFHVILLVMKNYVKI